MDYSLSQEQLMLFESNMPLVGFTLGMFRKEYLDFAGEWDDLYQIGSIALVYAVKKYEKNKGEFSTFAVKVIASRIKRQHYLNTMKKRIVNSGALRLDETFSAEDSEDRRTFTDTLQSGDDTENEVITHMMVGFFRERAESLGLSECYKMLERAANGEKKTDIAKEYPVSRQRLQQKTEFARKKILGAYGSEGCVRNVG